MSYSHIYSYGGSMLNGVGYTLGYVRKIIERIIRNSHIISNFITSIWKCICTHVDCWIFMIGKISQTSVILIYKSLRDPTRYDYFSNINSRGDLTYGLTHINLQFVRIQSVILIGWYVKRYCQWRTYISLWCTRTFVFYHYVMDRYFSWREGFYINKRVY